MILTVDIGNTNVVLGIFHGEKPVSSFRIASNKNSTPDEVFLLLSHFFSVYGIHEKKLEGAILCSVVPSLEPVFLEAIEKLISKKVRVIDSQKNFGLEVLIDRREELGADRIVNACAAYYKYKKFSVILDFGTATTFDVVSDRGEYLGGIIAPGVNLSAEALYRKASKLPEIAPEPPDKIIGKNTVDCLKSGLVLGYAEMVCGLLRRIEEELGHHCTVIATGGLAGKMHQTVPAIHFFDTDLTLWGLNYIFYHY